MEAITDLKHILHRGRGKYITKNDGNVTLVAYFFLLNLLNRITIKLHLIEKNNSTIISIPLVFSNIFTSNRANIFYTTPHDNLATSCSQIGQQTVAQLTKNSWGHNLAIINKCKSIEFDGFRNKLELNNYNNVFGEGKLV